MVTGKDGLTKGFQNGSYRIVELGFSEWQGRTAGKDGTVDKHSSPYPYFLSNQSVTLTNGTPVNALAANDALHT